MVTSGMPPIAVGLMGTVRGIGHVTWASADTPLQGEYTTGITPSGQSKSDKKVRLTTEAAGHGVCLQHESGG